MRGSWFRCLYALTRPPACLPSLRPRAGRCVGRCCMPRGFILVCFLATHRSDPEHRGLTATAPVQTRKKEGLTRRGGRAGIRTADASAGASQNRILLGSGVVRRVSMMRRCAAVCAVGGSSGRGADCRGESRGRGGVGRADVRRSWQRNSGRPPMHHRWRLCRLCCSVVPAPPLRCAVTPFGRAACAAFRSHQSSGRQGRGVLRLSPSRF